MKTVRVRIAPSPSGFLHVGTARTAVYNWLFARHHSGKFILRIEDTDVARSSPEMVEAILQSLTWLGLNWDEGPYYQSQRLELYRQWAQRLLDSGQGYYCFCSPDELTVRRQAAIARKVAWKYDRRCLNLSDSARQKFLAQKSPAAIRLFVPDGETVFRDQVYGKLKRDNADIEDLVCLRADSRPTYNFACVVDDAQMEISHVIRGNDHISNTFKQILIYRALGLEPPEFAHLPLILGTDRAKISKRQGAVAVTDYRDQGYLNEVILNFLALLGWSPGDGREIMSKKELIEAFSLERVTSANPVFDLQKLEWMNGEYIRTKSDDQLVDLSLPYLIAGGLLARSGLIPEERVRIGRVMGLLKERCRSLLDFVELGRYFFTDRFDYAPEGIKKQFGIPPKAGLAELLTELARRFSELGSFDREAAEACLRGYAEELGVKPAELIHPTRLALTGLTIGPGLFDIIDFLGQFEVVKRLRKAVEFIKSGCSASISV